MANYPRELILSAPGNIVLSIVNREYQAVTYRIEIRDSVAMVKEVGPVTLQDKQQWQQKVNFTPGERGGRGGNQNVEFLLFKAGEDGSYQSLHLWLNVSKEN